MAARFDALCSISIALRIAQMALGDRSTSSGIVAEKSAICRSSGACA
jgi:hypothetical protein